MDHKAYLSQCWGRRALALLNFKFLGPGLNPTSAQAIKHRDLPALPASQHKPPHLARVPWEIYSAHEFPTLNQKRDKFCPLTGQIRALCMMEISVYHAPPS